jgi:hypothetical protein
MTDDGNGIVLYMLLKTITGFNVTVSCVSGKPSEVAEGKEASKCGLHLHIFPQLFLPSSP